MVSRRALALAAAVLMLAAPSFAQLLGSPSTEVSFETATNFAATGVAATDGISTLQTSDIASADFDGDTDIDLAVVNKNTDELVILLNNGSGTFASFYAINIGTNPSSLVAADFDGDTVADLAVAVTGEDQVAIALGAGDGTFATAVYYDVDNTPTGIAVGDIDGGTGVDLVTANEFGGGADGHGSISILLNNGDGTFGAATTFEFEAPEGELQTFEPNGAAIADLDGDGLGDIAVAMATRDQVGVLLQAGDGSFTLDLYDVERDPTAVAIADFTGDGDFDLVVANTTDDTVSVLLGTGTGTFAASVAYATGNNPSDIAVADMNDDGELDLVTANRESDNVSVLLGNGDGTFDTADNHTTGGGPMGVIVANLNGDSDLDIATANQEGSLVDRDDVSVLLAGAATVGGLDLFALCGNFGFFNFTLTVLGLLGMKQLPRRRMR